MYVCMHACMHACKYVHMCTLNFCFQYVRAGNRAACMCAGLHLKTYLLFPHFYACLDAHVSAHTYVAQSHKATGWWPSISIHVLSVWCVRVWVGVCVQTISFTHVHIHIHTHTRVLIDLRIYTCLCTYMHVHTHTHTHTRVLIFYMYMCMYTYIRRKHTYTCTQQGCWESESDPLCAHACLFEHVHSKTRVHKHQNVYAHIRIGGYHAAIRVLQYGDCRFHFHTRRLKGTHTVRPPG